MKPTALALLSWAIVVHALSGGKPVDAVIDIAPTQQACEQEMKGKNITGECLEVESIIHRNAF